jgi:hypothetical protein
MVMPGDFSLFILRFDYIICFNNKYITSNINYGQSSMVLSFGEVLDAWPAYFEALVEIIGPHLLLKNDYGLHQLVKGFMQLLPGVTQ